MKVQKYAMTTLSVSSIISFFVFSIVVAVGLTASMFGMGATLSNFLGQQVVENFGHVASLMGSLVLSVVPIVIFGLFMPETLGDRDSNKGGEALSSSSVAADDSEKSDVTRTSYVEMS